MTQVAIIGYGRAGEAHARCYHALPATRIAAIVDPTPARRDAARHHFPDTAVHRSLTKIDTRIDLAVICTPHDTHERHIEQALLLGMHVFCEKPAFLDPGTGRRLMSLAQKRHLVIYPGHNYLFSPQLQNLKRHTTPEHIGPITHIEMTIDRTQPARGIPDWQPTWRSVASGGILTDHGPHCIYLSEWIAGRAIQQVTCHTEQDPTGVPDRAELTLHLHGTVTSHITLSWTADIRRTIYTVIGEQGSVTTDPTPRDTWHSRNHLVVPPPTDDRHAHDSWMPPLARDVLRHLCEQVATDPAQQALTVARVLAAASQSASLNGRSCSVC
ncbi:Gfo/Idh/MocA family protein [Micromonospora echinofusca]|uniref:Gfo/Idh/MocA family oxidoreductase n=1 Tax=Micromonospora echinofusca TaxID=47858 RepID=A0ABS3VUI4_MICEH|nr:Gfo/Idh/MocA family oxidoreductase [Micromonospora echinofusca]MBO4208155.1 Gfo/Idh/MocA family oxidoreductase [Micromonospora echinofusca]